MKKFIHKIKREKFYYYSTNIIKLLVPHLLYRLRLPYWLKQSNKYNQTYIESRVNYYINTHNNHTLTNSVCLKNYIFPKKNSFYFLDLAQITKYFCKKLNIKYKFGDITENQEELTIVKSRPIENSGNSVILKLDKFRHFNFVKDEIPFENKKDMAVWRGIIKNNPKRGCLVNNYSNHTLCNIKNNYLTIEQQLEYKFIISIEGYDVATNLKWILNSNSLCFMCKPIYETWFMEGQLIPNHHYVLLKDDYSDLITKIEYYKKHTKQAKEIIKNGNEWVKQFKNKKSEKIISLLVLQKYFEKTNQL